MMRVLVCGGRDYGEKRYEREHLNRLLDSLDPPMSVLIEGDAWGAGRRAKMWAKRKSVPVETFTTEWLKYGKAAGPVRNQRMLEEGRPDLVVAFPGGRGTRDMVERARAAGIPIMESV